MSAHTLKTWDEHLLQLRGILGGFPDRRTGGNLKYSMQDIGSSPGIDLVLFFSYWLLVFCSAPLPSA
jgi:hypothetical protein